jgi:hypothetical protein
MLVFFKKNADRFVVEANELQIQWCIFQLHLPEHDDDTTGNYKNQSSQQSTHSVDLFGHAAPPKITVNVQNGQAGKHGSTQDQGRIMRQHKFQLNRSNFVSRAASRFFDRSPAPNALSIFRISHT